MTLRVGAFRITPISPTEVLIEHTSGERGVFSILHLEAALEHFWATRF